MSTLQTAFLIALALSSVLVLTAWAYEAVKQARASSTQPNPTGQGNEGSPIVVRLQPLVPVVTKSAIATAVILAALTLFSPQIAAFVVSAVGGVQHASR